MTDPCSTCGQVHVCKSRPNIPCCTGHISSGPRKGEPCTQPRRKGQTKCRSHGGNAPRALAAAQERTERDNAEKALAAFGRPVEVDPGEELLDLIHHTAGRVRFLRDRVAELGEKNLIWGRTKKKVGGDDRGTTSEAKPHIWHQLLDHWEERLAKLCVEAIRIGLDERRVRIAEKQGEWTIKVLENVLAELGHDLNNPETAQLVERHLWAVS